MNIKTYSIIGALTLFFSTLSFAETPDMIRDDSKLIESLVQSAWVEVNQAPQLYPHFFVYGIEAEAKVGVSDLIELGSSLGIELHFEKR
jgi:hypothetical protein